jgi:hypothetical protein
MAVQTGYRLVIARPAWFTGDLAAVEKAVVVGSPERALHVIQGLLHTANVRLASGKSEGQYVDLKTYVQAEDGEMTEEDIVEFYTGEPRDCALYLEKMTLY